MVIFGEPRTGSNLFLDFLFHLRFKANPSELDLLILNELFIKDKVAQGRMLALLTDAMNGGFDLSFRGPNGVSLEKTYELLFDGTPKADPKNYIEFVRNQTTEDEWLAYQSLFQTFDHRDQFPVDWIHHIHHIPSRAQKAYFVFKVFSEHLDAMSLDPYVFITTMESYQMNAKYVVLWRRRIIESFVSYKIAVKKNSRDSWMGGQTSAQDTVYVDKKELEVFISTKKRYYQGIRDALVRHGLSFEVFEYERDLGDCPKQIQTVLRLQAILGMSGGNPIADEVLNEIHVTKQAQVSVDSQIENWDDVVAWGYGGETDSWEALFDTTVGISEWK